MTSLQVWIEALNSILAFWLWCSNFTSKMMWLTTLVTGFTATWDGLPPHFNFWQLKVKWKKMDMSRINMVHEKYHEEVLTWWSWNISMNFWTVQDKWIWMNMKNSYSLILSPFIQIALIPFLLNSILSTWWDSSLVLLTSMVWIILL